MQIFDSECYIPSNLIAHHARLDSKWPTQTNMVTQANDQIRTRDRVRLYDKDGVFESSWTQLCLWFTIFVCVNYFVRNSACGVNVGWLGWFSIRTLYAWLNVNPNVTCTTMFICVGHFETEPTWSCMPSSVWNNWPKLMWSHRVPIDPHRPTSLPTSQSWIQSDPRKLTWHARQS